MNQPLITALVAVSIASLAALPLCIGIAYLALKKLLLHLEVTQTQGGMSISLAKEQQALALEAEKHRVELEQRKLDVIEKSEATLKERVYD